MSNTGILLRRYEWLINTIRTGEYSRDEICNRYAREENINDTGRPMPTKTFHNHVNAIRDFFHINIVCNRSTDTYSIEEDPRESGVLDWLLESIAINNSIEKSQVLHNRILFENIPSGRKYLQEIIDAMSHNKVIMVKHAKFGHEPKTVPLEPWALKVFKQRWYLLGKLHYPDVDKPVFYSLDRVEKVDLSEETFSLPKQFDAYEYLLDFYGVTLIWEKPQRVKIKVDASQVKYFRTLPVHWTQKEVETNDEFSIFEYHLIPSFEFIQEILSHGGYVEVLEPTEFKEEFISWIDEMYGVYHK
jgi:hypothetical protein